MARWGWAAVLAFLLSGCTTSSTTTDGDRQVEDQARKANAIVQEKISAAKTAIEGRKLDEAVSLLEVGALAGREIELNLAQLQAVHGAPEKALPFSPENSAAARKRSGDDHASGRWIPVTLTILGTLLGIASTCAGMPFLAPIFPALAGKLGTWAKTGTEIITAVRAQAEQQGGSIHVQDILAIAKDKNVTAGIQKLVTRHADAHEEAMGHDFTMGLGATAAELAAARQPLEAPAAPALADTTLKL